MNKTLLRILFSLCFLIAPLVTHAMQTTKDIIIALIEFSVELYLLTELILFCVQSKRNKTLDWSTISICAAIFCIFIADTLYSTHLIKITNNYSFLSDCLYTGFAIFLIAFLLNKLNIFNRKFYEWGWISLAVFIIDVFFSCWFLIVPYYATTDTLAWKINGTIYMVLTTFIFALILPFVFRVLDRKTFWFLNLLLLLLTADIAIRYQDAFVDTFVFSWAEPAWCLAFMGLAWLTYFSKSSQDLFVSQPTILAPFISIRSLLTLAICGANILFLIGILVVKLYFFKTALDVSRILFLLFIFWTIANEFSLWLARDLSRTLQNMFKAKEHLSTDKILQFNLEQVTTKTPIFEISQILKSYNGLVVQTNKMMNIVIETNKNITMQEVASQVSHDIRSPLAALEIIVKSLSELPEEKRILIRSSIGRIKDIANNLLQINRKASLTELTDATLSTSNEERSVQLLSCLIEELISEKRMQFRSKMGIEINSTMDESAYGIFSEINIREFMRLLSNLINNSVESMNNSGHVTVSLTQVQTYAVLSIADNGCGIPPDILNRLGQRGVTFGKEGGCGLGLYHARTTIESWNGSLKIDSTPKIGTIVRIELPLAKAPKWFVEHLTVPACSTVVILDDDLSIHQIWDNRFLSLNANDHTIELLHFSTPEQLITWTKKYKSEQPKTLFLVDYELLGFDQVGLDVIEELEIQSEAILVTGRYEETELRSRCNRLGVQLIPKGIAGFIPISIIAETNGTLSIS